jgi:hypothetical protein
MTWSGLNFLAGIALPRDMPARSGTMHSTSSMSLPPLYALNASGSSSSQSYLCLLMAIIR